MMTMMTMWMMTMMMRRVFGRAFVHVMVRFGSSSTPRVAWNEVNDANRCVVISIPTNNCLSTGGPPFVVGNVTDDLVMLVPHEHVHLKHLADDGQFDGPSPRTVVAHVLYIRMWVVFACVFEPLTQRQVVDERFVHVHPHVVAYVTSQSHSGRFKGPW